VLVCTDLLGLSRGHQPKFAKRFANLGDVAVDAIGAYIAEVRAGTFPSAGQTYKANAARFAESPAPRSHRAVDVASEAHADDLDAPLALDLWH
jgi:3-methyl-2-oxobutanoate hydroxymethyltransferase